MENYARIKLTKEARRVFRQLADGTAATTPDMLRVHRMAIRELERHELVKCAKAEDGGIEAVRITCEGVDYLYANPKLRGPVECNKVCAVAVII